MNNSFRKVSPSRQKYGQMMKQMHDWIPSVSPDASAISYQD